LEGQKLTMTSVATFCSDAVCKFGQMLADERGATAIEYAMIASGVGAAIAATVFNLGTQVKQQLYDKISGIFQ
jgi:Flp pilus assembly pilin Flp